MAQGVTFTSKVFLGTDATAQSLRSVTGAPSFAAGDQQGDLAVSDNGQIYACDGANWSPLVNADGQTTMTSPLNIQRLTQGAVLIGNAGTSTATVETQLVALEDVTGAGLRAVLGIDSGTTTITSENTAGTPLPLNLAIGALQIGDAPGTSGQVLTSNGASLAPSWQTAAGGGITALTGDVTASGTGSVAATVIGMGGASSKVHFVIEGGQYVTLQAAVDAAVDNDVILVGPTGLSTPNTSWGDVTFPAEKRLSVVGLSPPRSYAPNVGRITYAPTTGLNALQNAVMLENLHITGDFTTSPGVNFGGTAIARLRLVGCTVNNVAAGAAIGVRANNSNAGSSLYLDGVVVNGSSTAAGSVAVQHQQGYTVIKGQTEIGNYQYQLTCAAGTVEMNGASLTGTLANEVIRITGGLGTSVSVVNTSIKNTTVNASGVNLTVAQGAFAMSDSNFQIGTGTGLCVLGANGAVFIYGVVTYSNSAAAAYNVRVASNLTTFPVAQSFTLFP